MIGGLLLIAAASFFAGRATMQKQVSDRDVELDYLRALRDAHQDRWRL